MEATKEILSGWETDYRIAKEVMRWRCEFNPDSRSVWVLPPGRPVLVEFKPSSDIADAIIVAVAHNIGVVPATADVGWIAFQPRNTHVRAVFRRECNEVVCEVGRGAERAARTLPLAVCRVALIGR